MLIKPKQIDLYELAEALATTIENNVPLLHLWSELLNSTYRTAVFSLTNGNIVVGQANFVVNYAAAPVDVIVHRNGSKQIENRDYIIVNGVGNFTVQFSEAVGPSQGGVFSEIIEINYY